MNERQIQQTQKTNPRLSQLILILLFGVLLVLAACKPKATDTPVAELEGAPEAEEETPAELIGDSIRGGLLYDKWWATLGLDAPEEDHALWATQDTNERDGSTTWRCKECHGWDYKGAEGAYGSGSHFTGFPGIINQSGGDANEILGILQGSANSDHDFSVVMDEQALVDLALFISEELVDYSEVIGDDKAAIGGDLAQGEASFQDYCSDCHGANGLTINFGSASEPEGLPELANGNPWEVLHKLRFGQPTEPNMPPGLDIGWTLDEQESLLAYVQSLPGFAEISSVNPLAVQGGLLYDKWWKTLELDEPTGDMPYWATQDTNERSGVDTWRCKECHGWDYRGVEGAYSSGSHLTGFPGVFAAASKSAEELTAQFDGTNANHDFSAYLDASAIEMLVAFIQEGLVDMTSYVNDDKTINGDAANGKTLYDQTCAMCHGQDGTTINFHDADEPVYIGTLANDNPWEFLHKVAHGQPGEPMPSGFNNGWSLEDIAGVVSYAQTLP